MKKMIALLIAVLMLGSMAMVAAETVDIQPDVLTAEGTMGNDNADVFPGVEIHFDFTRQTSQATNQIAIWVEDEEGTLVRTVYATRFTTQGGYTRREDSLSHWTKIFDIANKNQTEIDAISGPTLTTGKSEFFWDGMDQDGNKIPAGQYVIKLEGTLYWSSNVVFEATIDTANPNGEIIVTAMYSETNETNKDMIQNVEMEYAK